MDCLLSSQGKSRMSDAISMSITISPDHDGYMGRECPACEMYFKVMPGTGLAETYQMTCPYCQTAAGSDQFFTKEQVAYAQSIALRAFQGTIMAELQETTKRMEFETTGLLNIKVTTTVEGEDITIEQYQDKALETELTCEQCGLSYKIYGVFATCPDCASHNSKQILTTNMDVLRKQLENAGEDKLAEILKNAVSIFDAYGRTTTQHHTGTRISFQNLPGAEKNLQPHGLSVRAHLTHEEWEFLNRSFQKRHVLTHNLGVVDEDYLSKSNDPEAILGRKIRLPPAEVERTVDLLARLGAQLTRSTPPPPQDPAWAAKREAIKKNPYQLTNDALRLAKLLYSKDERGYGSYTDREDAQNDLDLPDLAFDAAVADLTEHHLVNVENFRLLQSTANMPLALLAEIDYQPAEDDKLIAEMLVKEDRQVPNHELETLTGLSKDRLNRSVRRLADKQAIELRTALGTAPFAFVSAKASGNTIRYLRNT